MWAGSPPAPMMDAMDQPNPPGSDHPSDIGQGHTPLIDSMLVHHRPQRTRRGNPVVGPDPGTPTSRSITLILAVLLAGVAILWQNLGHERQARLIHAPPEPPVLERIDAPAPGGGADMLARIYLRVGEFLVADPAAVGPVIEQVDAFAATDADEIRVALVAAELDSPQAALDRLNALEIRLFDDAEKSDADHPDPRTEKQRAADRAILLGDIDTLRKLYTDGPDTLDADQRQRLLDRYGLLGVYVLSRGDTPEAREDIIGSPWPIIVFGGAVLMVVGLGLLGGLGVLIWGIVWLANPRTTFRAPRPEPGGSVFLETYALFVGCFALLAIGLTIAEAHAPERVANILAAISLPLHWLLMFTVLWPVIRGMGWSSWRQSVGLHRGQGVLVEVGCGALAYLACIPLYFVGVGVTFGLILLWEALNGAQSEPTPPSNPIVDLVGSGDPVTIVLIFTLATVWAPITEELIFRGSLFRHLRARLHWGVAALVSATLFAFLHAYGPLMVTPLIVLGFSFAFMREWRGSIIASMTAHFLHNCSLMILMISGLKLLT